MSNWEQIKKLLIFDAKKRKKPLAPLITKQPATGDDVIITARQATVSNNPKKSYRFYLDSASSKYFNEVVKNWVVATRARLPSKRHSPASTLFINQILNDFAIHEQKNLDALLNFEVKRKERSESFTERRNIFHSYAYYVPLNLSIVELLNKLKKSERSAIIAKCIKVFLELPKKEQDRIMSEAMELVNEVS